MNPRCASVLFFAMACSQAADQPFEALNLEAHGFASFGWMKTWGNNWLAPDTTSGTTELWEAAVNAIARPMDRLRLGAQLFARDLGKFDNGTPTLDWAYADWRAADACGMQVGRVKIPIGLYNEALDVDAAHASVFLPPNMYVLRGRDLFISIDGGKVYGLVPMAGAGALEYTAYAGNKRLNEQAGLAVLFTEMGLGTVIDRIAVDWVAGGMLHWHTPVEGLGVRVTLVDAHGFEVDGRHPDLGVDLHLTIDDYWYGIASLIYETSLVTLAAEYGRIRGHGTVHCDAMGVVEPRFDDTETAYLSATWHWRNWCEFYGAGEAAYADPARRSYDRSYTWVLAAHLMPLPNWSLKAEFRDVHGAYDTSDQDNPTRHNGHWQVLALKTTVDF